MSRILGEFAWWTSNKKLVDDLQPLLEQTLKEDVEELPVEEQMKLLEGHTILEVLLNPILYQELRDRSIFVGLPLPPIILDQTDLDRMLENKHLAGSRLLRGEEDENGKLTKLYWSVK